MKEVIAIQMLQAAILLIEAMHQQRLGNIDNEELFRVINKHVKDIRRIFGGENEGVQAHPGYEGNI